MAEAQEPGVINIENELTCSICTELLYQPLTLLDCLHTFCGSCLKEWFAWQASQKERGKSSPISCPSCRASVRETRPNATVTTLLEMYMKANPGKGRTDAEKDEIAKGYKAGENVLPKVKRRKETAEEVEDRRMVEEARELSLRDVGIRGSGYARGLRHQTRETTDARPPGDTHQANDITAREASRVAIGHQNSLRSILSSSDLGDSADMEEEVLRQIMDSLLDGIDLNHLSVAQEEELTEKIAEAYRLRHHRRRSRSRELLAAQIETEPASRSQNDPATEGRRERGARPPSTSQHTATPSPQPHSRPHLSDSGYPRAPRNSPRTSSRNRTEASSTPPSSSRDASSSHRQATRSATDLSDRPHSSSASHQEHSRPNQRRARTENERQSHVSRSEVTPPTQRQVSSNSQSNATPSTHTIPPSGPEADNPESGPGASHDRRQDTASTADGLVQSPSSTTAAAVTSSPPEASPSLFKEPSVSCRRCGKTSLEYTLHWHCAKCEDGDYSLCQRCYRTRAGCLHWYGFGAGAMQRYERLAPPEGYPPDHELPHRLTGRRYRPPRSTSLVTSSGHRSTTSDPASRLQSGPFCSNCSSFSPTYFWQCSTCNEGEWGFCNTCVNRGRCCTHALLPTALSSHLQKSPPTSPTASSSQSQSQSQAQQHHPNLTGEMEFTTLSISTHCDSCTYPIPPSTTRFHCPVCNSGDYDLCTACYLKFLKRGVIAPEDGPKGWRRCPQGHRMIVVGFETSEFGQRRIVVEDLVGGHALKDDGVGLQRQLREERRDGGGGGGPARNVPPSGGIGIRALARWGYWAEDEKAEDELGFPKGAEIRECFERNEDWLQGIYCGKEGLLPSKFVWVLERIG